MSTTVTVQHAVVSRRSWCAPHNDAFIGSIFLPAHERLLTVSSPSVDVDVVCGDWIRKQSLRSHCFCRSDSDRQRSSVVRWQAYPLRSTRSPRPTRARSASVCCTSTSCRHLPMRSGIWLTRHCTRCFSTWFMLSAALFVQPVHDASMFWRSIGSNLSE